MKIAIRMLVLTLVLAAGFSLTSFEGPGPVPNDPPVVAA
jgi:hypothetical protein